ncbi:F420-dependent methylenetetrahydromethanopterin dehydrogenase [Candidatus Bathyarchaeota archaeon]|nr:F420-dependent methylenetetrahydromethanopterin dehydrogenase [Candidatus Bathyarchaeota archaeon]
MSDALRIGILKLGCIGTLPLIEFLLDERAERTDINIKVSGSGAKLELNQCIEATKVLLEKKPSLVMLIGPAQASQGPSEARRMLATANMPTVVISDSPAKKIVKELEEIGFGYIIVEADSMIGARREFLDPAEMAIYNSDMIKVLAVTGTYNLIVDALDKTIEFIKSGKKPEMPRIIVEGTKAVEAAGFSNPYAKAKAFAAYEMACQASKLTTEACFRVQDPNIYVPMVATAHEIVRSAAKLADEAREIEKRCDTVFRKPHFKDGAAGTKKALMEKPKKGA